MKNWVEKYKKNNFILYFMIAVTPLVIPYASNATVIMLFLPFFSYTSFKDLKKGISKRLKDYSYLSILFFIGICFLSSIWSISPKASLEMAFRVLIIFLGFVLFSLKIDFLEEKQLKKLEKLFFYSFSLTLLFYLFDIYFDFKLAYLIKGWKEKNDALMFTRIGRGASILALFFWSSLYYLYQKRKKSYQLILFFIFCFFIIYKLPLGSVVLGFSLAGIAFFLAFILKRKALILLGACLVFYNFTAPVFFQRVSNLENANKYHKELASSWKHRVAIWEFVSKKTMDKPILGYGFETSRKIGEKKDKVILNPYDEKAHQAEVELLPLHPHNGVLQIWLELGFVGIVGFCFVLLGFLRKISAIEHNLFAFSCCFAMFINVFSVFVLSFGAWQSWWLATIALSLCFMKLVLKNNIYYNDLSSK